MRAWVLDEEGVGVRVTDVPEPVLKGGGAVLSVLAAHIPAYTAVDHLHEHFLDPVVMRRGRYIAPAVPGFSTQMREESLRDYEFPVGDVWKTD